VVSGTVFKTVDGIQQPLADHKVDFFIGQVCGPSGWYNCDDRAGVVSTDANGRYTLQVTVLSKTRVYVAGAGLHAAGQQPCLASALGDKDTTVDVEIFAIGSFPTPSAAAGPMITGVAYETTPEGRKPLRGVWAELQVGNGDYYPIARIQTDDAGRFFFCRVNAPVQLVVSSFKEMVVAGYKQGVAFIPGTGDMFFELELRR
jgi:hypothetical protein